MKDKSLFLSWHSKKIWFSQAIITSGPMQQLNTNPPLSLPYFFSTTIVYNNIQTRACRHILRLAHTHTHSRTCWPDLLPRGEMRSNSAFQHTTSDYLFSFMGRFELVMLFSPFCMGLRISLSLSYTHWESLLNGVWWQKWWKKKQKKQSNLASSCTVLSYWNTLYIQISIITHSSNLLHKFCFVIFFILEAA